MREKNYNPSFSSTLLDAIYHSIDESEHDEHQKHNKKNKNTQRKREEMSDYTHFPAYLKSKPLTTSYSSKSSYSSSSSYLKSNPVTSNFSSSTSSNSSYLKSNPVTLTDTNTNRPKPIRTSIHVPEEKHGLGDLVKTKSKAMKIYSNLKKVKQPISPGGKLATFLNSIFNSGNPKKAATKSKSETVSACSSASSFTRSCLSKNTSTGAKRTVRFCENEPNFHEKKESGRDLLMKYQTKVEFEDDSDDDSCASSDLFELDNISVIGGNRYREELPVYETTYLGTNRAIARGLIV